MDSENVKCPTPQPAQYADEVLCANWVPLASVPVETAVRPSAPEAVDAEELLARLYRCQQ
jgi:hypothetical protein